MKTTPGSSAGGGDVPRETRLSLVRVHLPQVDIVFSQGATAASVSFISVAKNTWVLLSPPQPDEVKEPISGDENHAFELRNGVWVETALPKPPAVSCDEVLKRTARALYTAQMSCFAEKDTFESNLDTIGFRPPTGVTVSSLKVTPNGFRAEVSWKGATVRIDEANSMTFVAECRD